jgi:hypothetical protein
MRKSNGRGVTLASQSRELESHLLLAKKIRGLESHLSSASYIGESFRQAFPASQSGGVSLQVNSANIQWVLRMKLKQRKEE